MLCIDIKMYLYQNVMEISISHILDNADKYKQMVRDRFLDKSQMKPECEHMSVDIDEIIRLHRLYVDTLIRVEKTRKLKNIISKSNNKTKNKSDSDQSDLEFDFSVDLDVVKILEDENLINNKYSLSSLRKLGSELKPLLEIYENDMKTYLEKRNALVEKVPNIIHPSVPIFESEENNQIIKITQIPETNDKYLDQYQLCCKLGIIEEAGNIAGHRGYFLVNEGVRLNYALINYGLDFLQKKGYKLMYTPHFMKKEQMEQVCQLSDFQETLYNIEGGELFLIATSEQPMTSYFSNTQNNNLPIKLCGISSCYRKEAGKHGKDTLGIFRVHQFEKIEQFCVTEPDKSWETMEEMMKTSEEFYESLGISYRVVNIVSKELNNAAAMKYDLEGFFKGSKKFRELVSCSNTTDYFSRKIRVKGNNKEFAHMLNSTLFANTRIICCLLETHQCEDGVIVPEVLRKYYDCEKILFKN